MQTFLPYPDFQKSAESLDDQRLGKQRVEGYQILRNLCGYTDGWSNHPAVKMWQGHEKSLLLYTTAMCCEWIMRGFQDTIGDKLLELELPSESSSERPSWMGNEDFHRSHRANLVTKDHFHYGPQFGMLPYEGYVWPI